MMQVSILVSRLGITDLENKITIYTNLIKLFNFEKYIILFLFISSIQTSNNNWNYRLSKYMYNSSKKKVVRICMFSIFENASQLQIIKINSKKLKRITFYPNYA